MFSVNDGDKFPKPIAIPNAIINHICDSIPNVESIDIEAGRTARYSIQVYLRKQLSEVVLVPLEEIYVKLKNIVLSQFRRSVIKDDERVGSFSAESLSAAAIQSTMDTFQTPGAENSIGSGLSGLKSLLWVQKFRNDPKVVIHFKPNIYRKPSMSYTKKDIVDMRAFLVQKTIEDFLDGDVIVAPISPFVGDKVSKEIIKARENACIEYGINYLESRWWHTLFALSKGAPPESIFVMRLTLDIEAMYAHRVTMEMIADTIVNIKELSKNIAVVVYGPLNSRTIDIFPGNNLKTIETYNETIKFSRMFEESVFLTDIVRPSFSNSRVKGIIGLSELRPIEANTMNLIQDNGKRLREYDIFEIALLVFKEQYNIRSDELYSNLRKSLYKDTEIKKNYIDTGIDDYKYLKIIDKSNWEIATDQEKLELSYEEDDDIWKIDMYKYKKSFGQSINSLSKIDTSKIYFIKNPELDIKNKELKQVTIEEKQELGYKGKGQLWKINKSKYIESYGKQINYVDKMPNIDRTKIYFIKRYEPETQSISQDEFEIFLKKVFYKYIDRSQNQQNIANIWLINIDIPLTRIKSLPLRNIILALEQIGVKIIKQHNHELFKHDIGTLIVESEKNPVEMLRYYLDEKYPLDVYQIVDGEITVDEELQIEYNLNDDIVERLIQRVKNDISYNNATDEEKISLIEKYKNDPEIALLKNYVYAVASCINWEKEEKVSFKTNESVYKQLLDIPWIDRTKTISNNIRETQEMFGIDAARNYYQYELSQILLSIGASVNQRHPELVTDYIFCPGIPVGVNMVGIKHHDIGFLTEAFVEQFTQQIIKSAGKIESTQNIVPANVTGSTLVPRSRISEFKESNINKRKREEIIAATKELHTKKVDKKEYYNIGTDKYYDDTANLLVIGKGGIINDIKIHDIRYLAIDIKKDKLFTHKIEKANNLFEGHVKTIEIIEQANVFKFNLATAIIVKPENYNVYSNKLRNILNDYKKESEREIQKNIQKYKDLEDQILRTRNTNRSKWDMSKNEWENIDENRGYMNVNGLFNIIKTITYLG